MSEKNLECPKCEYSRYKWYEPTEETVIVEEGEMPVHTAYEQPAVVVVQGLYWFCTVCGHKWDKTPIQSSISTVREE